MMKTFYLCQVRSLWLLTATIASLITAHAATVTCITSTHTTTTRPTTTTVPTVPTTTEITSTGTTTTTGPTTTTETTSTETTTTGPTTSAEAASTDSTTTGPTTSTGTTSTETTSTETTTTETTTTETTTTQTTTTETTTTQTTTTQTTTTRTSLWISTILPRITSRPRWRITTRECVEITTKEAETTPSLKEPGSEVTKALESGKLDPTTHVNIAAIVTGGVVFSILILAAVWVYRIRTSRDNSSTDNVENRDAEAEMTLSSRPVSLADTKVVSDEYEEFVDLQNRQSTAFYEQPQPYLQETTTNNTSAGGDQKESINVYEHPLTSQQQEMPNMYGNVADTDQRQSTACLYEHPLPPQPDESNTYDDISIKN